ncbi:MAG: corrinoid protein [Nitrososphaerales archaeon]
MNLDEIKKKLMESLGDLNEEEAQKYFNLLLEEKVPPLEIINTALKPGMDIVGSRYETGEYFLSDLMLAGHIMKGFMNILTPMLKSDASGPKLGTVVIGTVRGDMHDIGKNLFGTLLIGAGFDVLDLGTDVAPEKFLDKVKEVNAVALGMSTLLSTHLFEMKNTVDLFKREGYYDKVMIIIGGRPVTEEFAKEIGATYGKDALTGVKLVKRHLGFEE